MPHQPVPVIDLFAGPGGLGEGFGRLRHDGRRAFRSALSIEKDASAHKTLTLRAFYRQFDPGEVPADYFERARGTIDTAELFRRHPSRAADAQREVWLAELGSSAFPLDDVRDRVRVALGTSKDWVLLGGPPCQAYSLVGRSRNRGIAGYRFETDARTRLYLEYLQLIADFLPAVFLMENVKGLLSAKLEGHSLFDRIVDDLTSPAAAIRREGRTSLHTGETQYDLYPIVGDDRLPGTAITSCDPKDYVVRAERYGVPQARHRLILIGVRRGFGGRPTMLAPSATPFTVRQAICDLPPLRSGLSREDDSPAAWADAIEHLGESPSTVRLAGEDLSDVAERIARVGAKAARLSRRPRSVTGDEQPSNSDPKNDWYESARMRWIANHESRSHMRSDLLRYLFASAFAEVRGRSPELANFPKRLTPAHESRELTLAG